MLPKTPTIPLIGNPISSMVCSVAPQKVRLLGPHPMSVESVMGHRGRPTVHKAKGKARN